MYDDPNGCGDEMRVTPWGVLEGDIVSTSAKGGVREMRREGMTMNEGRREGGRMKGLGVFVWMWCSACVWFGAM